MAHFHDKAKQLEPSLTGSALGVFAGDALGAPVEGMDRHTLATRTAMAGQLGWVSEMEGGGRFAPGSYTDDTQLMIGQLEALAEDDALPPGLLAAKYAANYQPWRGYGSSTGEALGRLQRGETTPEALSRPSYGNGGAMGIAPLGVYFCQRMDWVMERAERACRTTHHHPEALMCAVAVACCGALLARRRFTGKPLDFGEILASLRALPALQEGPPSPDPEAYPLVGRLAHLANMTELPGLPPRGRSALLAETFGNSLRAIESVPLAIGAAVSAPSLREAVEVAVNAGGDTDTQGAMAGGMAGAYYGPEGMPPSWLEAMENQDKGRDYLLRLTRKLAGLAPR